MILSHWCWDEQTKFLILKSKFNLVPGSVTTNYFSHFSLFQIIQSKTPITLGLNIKPRRQLFFKMMLRVQDRTMERRWKLLSFFINPGFIKPQPRRESGAEQVLSEITFFHLHFQLCLLLCLLLNICAVKFSFQYFMFSVKNVLQKFKGCGSWQLTLNCCVLSRIILIPIYAKQYKLINSSCQWTTATWFQFKLKAKIFGFKIMFHIKH